MAPSSWVLAAASLLFGQALAQCQGTSPTPRWNIQMESGYKSKLLLTGLSTPRGVDFDRQGNLLIVERGRGISYVKLTEAADGSVCVQEKKLLINDAQLNHGIAMSPDGNMLYVSSTENVYQYVYDGVAGTATGRKTLVTGMTVPGTTHPTRSLLVSRADPDLLLVQRGSNGNLDADAAREEIGRSVVRYFNISDVAAASQPFATGGSLLGMGLRNSEAIGENVPRGEFWSVENSVDNLARQGRTINNENPAEEMNFHGRIEAGNPRLGGNYGYPECVTAWELSTLANPALSVGSQIAITVPVGGNVSAADAACQKYIAPRLSFPSHTAPLDVKFTADGKYAFIAFHGSWNRSPPDGYRVERVEFGADGQPVANSTSKTAGVTVMKNGNNAVCPGQCFRPVGLAFDNKGRLFMSSDSTGEVYVLSGGTGLGA
ncbi:hypothetical protein MGG_09782 [Pyricularia oryzae 70-15]|uniref:Pyrroloquinoline quinone-dependent pyranose dehydrogenase beta-propeller domain-containing protein n=3 Tax=Pyricularia oryzae TaxID=318829 RepID=G4N9Z7_PYRO7|nr:uncharacterized protein MGG_09782 [Pyricularia oryzae 70-15]EHA51243.1 hypothetical protein MGG_09782 [Pyricularia oryzae 70-15]ELQ41793.1 hypothetical protein OOU_Y34scaffold00254g11 [Pyricularia oryzae Y34]KAI7913572.1 hypothetical protein M9X92_009358 [Pyricularia oryzae]KAI7914955.1 hypothetical protein M0657_009256 [Pyricularia oryzae]